MGRRKNMKRLMGTLAVAAALLAGLAAPAATAKDAKGPPCTNFIKGDASYNSATGMVTAEMTLDAAGCTGTYLLDIFDLSGSPQLADNVEPSSYSVDPETGNTIVNFMHTVSSGLTGVCLVVESYHSGHVADRAPNTGCEPISGAGASNAFN
jgi:hypothetical protein